MIKSPIPQLLGATCFQFYVSIVDPSILAQPATPTEPAVSTVAAPASPGTATTAQSTTSQSGGTSGALQQGATQPAQ